MVVLAAVRTRRMPPANVGVHSAVVPRDLVGMDSEVRRALLPTGTVYAAGEEWTARSIGRPQPGARHARCASSARTAWC